MSTLYSYLLAFNPQKVLLAIAETGFECRVQQVNLFNGESLRPWFMRINPNSTVPVLVVNEVRGEAAVLCPAARGRLLCLFGVQRCYLNSVLQGIMPSWSTHALMQGEGMGAPCGHTTVTARLLPGGGRVSHFPRPCWPVAPPSHATPLLPPP